MLTGVQQPGWAVLLNLEVTKRAQQIKRSYGVWGSESIPSRGTAGFDALHNDMIGLTA